MKQILFFLLLPLLILGGLYFWFRKSAVVPSSGSKPPRFTDWLMGLGSWTNYSAEENGAIIQQPNIWNPGPGPGHAAGDPIPDPNIIQA